MIAPGQAERDAAASAARHAALEIEEILARLAQPEEQLRGEPGLAAVGFHMAKIHLSRARECLHGAADVLYGEEETK